MKILIPVHMEGSTGVTTGDQVTPGHAEHPRLRKLMTQDVNAAIRGACEADADEVIVMETAYAAFRSRAALAMG